MDDLADRDPEFWLWTLNPGDTSYHAGLKLTMSELADKVPPGGDTVLVDQLNDILYQHRGAGLWALSVMRPVIYIQMR